jgi:glyoxylase-like metal-dependent hydrolase (beta-lactamase superfamily II)
MLTRILAGSFLLSASLATAQELVPYPGASDIAPPMVHNDHYDAVLEAGKGTDIDPAKGYRIEDLGEGAYMVTEGVYQMMIVKTAEGLVVVDAPPPIGDKILKAAQEIAPGARITHLVYSHAHVDHIGFAAQLVATNPGMVIVAHQETADLLARANDPNRPMPTATFDGINQPFTLTAADQSLQLNYSGPNHEPGNIEIWHADSQTLMLIDVVFPGWMMWRRMAIAHDIPGVFDLVGSINARYDFKTLVSGHVGRTGTRADVEEQWAFMTDLHGAAMKALGTTAIAEGMRAEDTTNPWAVFDNFIDRVTVQCVAELAAKWREKLSGFDVFIYDQCMAMEQSIRVDGPSL